jgi:acyl-CoA reductase-like NAD-dependent aldehyde dehydrogenase
VTGVRTIEHCFGGEPTAGSPAGTGPVVDPATGARQAEVVPGSAADVDEAVRVSEAALTERRPEPAELSAASYHFPTSR